MVKKKSKRRMPAHIVLPNGMWRFVKRGTKSKTLKTRKRVVKRKVKSMARRRTGRVRSAARRYRSAGGMTLTKGLFPVPKLLASALLGAGVAAVQKRFVPQMIPYQGAAAGFVVGGVAGAAGAFASEMLLGNGTAAVSTAGGW